MELPTESWGELIVYLVEKNLDSVTRRRWEEYPETLDIITTDTLLEFLQRRCQVLERASLSENLGDVTGRSKFNSYERNDKGKQKQPFHVKSCKAKHHYQQQFEEVDVIYVKGNILSIPAINF